MPRTFSIRFSRAALFAAAALAACSSSADQSVAPQLASAAPSFETVATPQVYISQIYGGGGNSGATLKNDFIELFNAGTASVILTGWSVQYASSAGSFSASNLTPLTGSIAPGAYYLVVEGPGAGGTVSLPTADATGNIMMSATSAKVALVSSTTALGVACPAAGTTIDFVAYGTAVTGCGTTTSTLANTTAALRNGNGCTNTHSPSADFTVGAPAPRNSASPTNSCAVAGPPATVTVTPSPGSVHLGSTLALTAAAKDAGGTITTTTFAWTSSDPTIASVDASSGVVTGHIAGSSATISATSSNDIVGSSLVTVLPPADPATVSVTPAPTTVTAGATRALTATAKDADGNVVATTFTWGSSDATIASVDASGVVTGHIAGSSATITATSSNGKVGSSLVTVQPPASNVTVGGRATPLPIGFETQLFASGTDKSGAAVTTVTWSSSNSSIVSVDANGVITAAGNGSAQIIATTPDLSTGQTTITTEVGLLAAGARSGHNLELGTPTDADPSDDIIITRKQYTLSYNPTHAGPNWVSWNMDKSHLGSLDRCNCFTQDTTLVRMGYPAYTTADYIAGGLWDRGHMEPSADQTTTDYENAYTFFLSNTLPQKHDLNAGPWELLENALRDSANAPGGREIYVIAGGIFTHGVGLGTLNNAGKIGIPDSTWKIAVILPAGAGLADIHSPADASVIAVNMPNVVGISGNPWQMYTTTIAKIEASTGYNFLNLIDESIQCKIEVRDCLPVSHNVSASGSNTVAAGTQFILNTSATDADGADGPWKMLIDWGDGTTNASTLFALPTDAHPFAHGKTWSSPGIYTVRVSITDKKGGVSVSTLVVTVTP